MNKQELVERLNSMVADYADDGSISWVSNGRHKQRCLKETIYQIENAGLRPIASWLGETDTSPVRCSKCGFQFLGLCDFDLAELDIKYCPHCGAYTAW